MKKMKKLKEVLTQFFLKKYSPNESENHDEKKSGGEQNLGSLILLTSKVDRVMTKIMIITG